MMERHKDVEHTGFDEDSGTAISVMKSNMQAFSLNHLRLTLNFELQIFRN